MRNLKVNCSSLRCPHCGSAKYDLICDDVFVCEYCGQKFNFDLETVDFNSENKIFIEELKSCFEEKVIKLYEDKKLYYSNLVYYKKLENPKKFSRLSIICLVISILLLYLSIVYSLEDISLVDFSISIPCVLISLTLVVISKIRNKKRFNNYHNYVEYCAEKVVECQAKIDDYNRLISKLVR